MWNMFLLYHFIANSENNTLNRKSRVFLYILKQHLDFKTVRTFQLNKFTQLTSNPKGLRNLILYFFYSCVLLDL